MFKKASEIFGAAVLSAEDYDFMRYVSEYGKSYGTVAEFEFRKDVFIQKQRQINEWNAGDNTHTQAHNWMSDMTEDEYKVLLGYKGRAGPNEVEILDETDLADSVDWRSKGAVTPVKNQGQCGSCWAFSTTGSVEGAYFLKHGKLQSFSEQQLVDCAGGKWGNQGCNGGLMDNAFNYIKGGNPLETESEYPYIGRKHLFGCRAKAGQGVGTVASFKDISKSATQLKASIAQGPTSVAIEADKSVFQSYRSGVITSSSCGTQLDHGVLAVGYGTENGTPYFLVKNSWGSTWGDQGYVKIGQSGNICGILSQPSRPSE